MDAVTINGAELVSLNLHASEVHRVGRKNVKRKTNVSDLTYFTHTPAIFYIYRYTHSFAY